MYIIYWRMSLNHATLFIATSVNMHLHQLSQKVLVPLHVSLVGPQGPPVQAGFRVHLRDVSPLTHMHSEIQTWW